jgi:hypothetical protein
VSVFALLLLALVGIVVAVPLLLVLRRPRSGNAAATTSPAEFLVYLILIGATLIATNSVSFLIEIVIPGSKVVTGSPEEVALPLATLLVSGIIAVTVWLRLERQASGPRPARAFYLSAVIGVAMAVVATALVGLGNWAVGNKSFTAANLADLLAFGGVWLLHERVRRRGEELDELRSLAGSTIGLAGAVGGFGAILAASLEAVMSARQVIVGSGGIWHDIRGGLVLLVVGAAFFWWFWLRDLMGEAGTWRNGYCGVVSALAWFAGLGSLATSIYLLLILALGVDGWTDVQGQLPWALTVVITAGIVFWHHRDVLGKPRTSVVQMLEYLFSAAGLVAGAGAVVVLAAELIEQLSRPLLAGDPARPVLGAVATLLVAGFAVWRYWLPVQRRAGEADEQRSMPRRFTLVGLLVLFAVTGAGALVAVLYVLLRAALGSTAGMAAILSWSVPLTVVAGSMTWYLARIRPRRDHPALAQQPAVKVGTITLVATDPGPLPKMIEGMRFLRRSDGVGIVDENMAGAIVAALTAAEGRAALVTVDADDFAVIPLV